MKKTHQDRVDLIDRLERKYAKKVRLQNQMRRQNIKNALRAMRGQELDADDRRADSLDGILNQDSRIV